jgi:glycosyltransferase involved in cell wall biosynthesis
MNISIIIPCYNEQFRIEKTLRRIIKWYFSQKKINIELLLIDDGSSDNTFKILKEFSKKYKFTKVYKKKHTGHIKTLFYGFRKSKYSIVGNMEADDAVSVNYFTKFCKYIINYDVVTADRVTKFFQHNNKKNLFRMALSIFYLILFKILFSSNIKDAQAGFRLYKRVILFKFLKRIKIKHDGLKVAELILKQEKAKIKIKQVTVINKHDDDSRLVPKLSIKNLKAIVILIFEVVSNLIILRKLIK